jgi:hypothetical protein
VLVPRKTFEQWQGCEIGSHERATDSVCMIAYLMKSIKRAAETQWKPSAECILMVVSLAPPRGYRLSEAAAALNAAGVLAPVYCVGFDAKIEYPKGWRKV